MSTPTRLHPPNGVRRWLAPRYWPAWAGMGIARLLTALPWCIQYQIGVFLGAVLLTLARHRVATTRVNLAMCFPDLDDTRRETLLTDIFRQAGVGMLETLNGWFRSPDYYRDKVSLRGTDHLAEALASGKGVLLVGGHYSMLDLGALLVAPVASVDMVYRPQSHPLIEWLMVRGRTRFQGQMISYRDMRGLIGALRRGRIVWYPTDQDAGRRHTVFAPFFGVPASTLTTPSRWVQTLGCRLLMLHFRRVGHTERYEVVFEPGPDFTGHAVEDASALNLALETMIRREPTQYMWYHRRFKTRPAGETSPYAVRDISHRSRRRSGCNAR